jgi:hypothetical protein
MKEKVMRYIITILLFMPLFAQAQYVGGSGGGQAVSSFEYPCVAYTSGGEIESNQSLIAGVQAQPITNKTLPGGSTEDVEYQWFSSTTSSTAGFSPIEGATQADYAPGFVTQTTWYVRAAFAACSTPDYENGATYVTSNVVQIEVININLEAVPTILCARSVFDISYSTNVVLNVGNIFTVQLSNASGSFASPVAIGTLAGTSASGSISVTIPANILDGSGYRIRIVSSNTSFTGTDNGQDITIGDYCPAGLGIIPALWLRADRGLTQVSDKVSAWADQSGRGNDHEQTTGENQPGYESNTANFNPTVTFDGSQYVEDADGFLDYASTYNTATLFLAHNSATPHSNRGLYGQFVTLNPGGISGRYMGHGEFNGTQYFGVKADSGNDWVQLPSGESRMNAYVLNTFGVGNGTQNLWFNGGDNFNTSLGFDSFTAQSGKPWVVGVAPAQGNTNATAFYQKGKISELVVFYEDLSMSNRFKVETYLGIKYGINLLHNYYSSAYNGSNAGTTTVYDISSYGNNVAGIARDDDYRLYQKQSRSMNSVPYAGMVMMGLGSIAGSNADNTGTIDNGLYLVWGDNGESPIQTDVPGTSLKTLSRSWKVQASGQPVTTAAKPGLQVSINLSDISITSADYTCLKLMIDRDGDGNLETGTVDEYTAAGNSTVSAVIFNNVVWDTDNSGSDVFFLITNCCSYPTAAGTIAGAQSICPNTTAAPLTSSTGASGQVGDLQYRWQRSTVSATTGFTDIANTNSVGYSPGVVAQTTWYRRLASVTCFEDWSGAAVSNVIQVVAIDTIAPTIMCPATQTLILGPTCSATLPDYRNMATNVNDNCGVQSVSQLPVPGTLVSSSGPITVTLTVLDVNGLSTSCSFTVNKVDITPPAINCSNTTIRFNGEESIPITVSDVVAASDNCGVASIVLSPSAVTCQQLGQVVPVQVVVTDINGNVSACMVQVTVRGLPCGWRHNSGSVGTCTSDIDYNTMTGHWPSNATNCRYGSPFTSDKLMFAQYQLCGDGSITAQVIGLDGAQPYAGITMRESNDPGSKKVQLMINRISNILRREVRTTTGAQCFPTEFPSPCERTWLRIVRTGNIFRGYTSQDGLTWWYVMQVHVPMNSCIEIGLVLTNMQLGIQGNGTFANVSVTGGQSGPTVMSPGIEASLDMEEALDVRVYPNPVAGDLQVDLSAYAGRRVALGIYDMQGQLLMLREIDEVGTEPETMDMRGLPAGVYQLQVRTAGAAVVSQRVIVHKL